MKQILQELFESADRYLQASSWKDLALIKFCLFSTGVLAALAVPARRKKAVGIAAFGVFAATYIPLMAKYIPFLLKKDTQA